MAKSDIERLAIVETRLDALEKIVERLTAVELQIARLAQALSYLRETDWMVTRFAETGKPVPDDVALRREGARKAASK